MIPTLPMRLRSDFWQPYDHYFAASIRSDLPAWDRMSATLRSRIDDHAAMEAAGLRVPKRGRLGTCFSESDEVVCYDDPLSHRGNGKSRGDVGSLLLLGADPSSHACSWVGDIRGGHSVRLFAAGRLFVWIAYRSSNDWRSNVGDVAADVMDPPANAREHYAAAFRLQRMLREPLIAVDYVPGIDGLYAVDLNTAPGVLNDGTVYGGWLALAEQIYSRHAELRGEPVPS